MHGDPLHQVNSNVVCLMGVGELTGTLTNLGYESCRVLTGPEFQSVFNLQLWASNAKLINYYMLYGCVVPLFFYRWEM